MVKDPWSHFMAFITQNKFFRACFTSFAFPLQRLNKKKLSKFIKIILIVFALRRKVAPQTFLISPIRVVSVTP